MWIQDVPYVIVNLCYKIDTSTDDGSFCWQRAKAEASDYSSVLTIDDPDRYEAWLMDPKGWDFSRTYDGYGRAWTHNDPVWRYIEKFDTFHFREWIADSLPTKMILWELQYYKENGRLPSVYRHSEDCIIMQHLRCLMGYWD